MKRCVDCGISKPLAEFWRSGAGRRKSRCKDCANARRDACWHYVDRICEGCGELMQTKDRGVQTSRFHMACRPRARILRGSEHWSYKGDDFRLREDSYGNPRWKVVCRDGREEYYSRVVMAAHVGRLLHTDETVHHKNMDTLDDRIENLQLVTRAEHKRIHNTELLTDETRRRISDGVRRAYREGRKARPKSKLTWDDVHEIRRQLAVGTSVGRIAAQWGISRDSVYNIKWGTRWAE